MGLAALVMAGGRGSRMEGRLEKPLRKVSEKSMLQHVIQALRNSTSISRIVVASSPITPATTAEAKKLGAETIITPGAGFHEDMRFAIRELSLGEVLVISSDLPFVTAELIDEAVRKYTESGKPALAVMTHAALHERRGSKPDYAVRMNGESLVPVGINILDGRRVGEGALEQVELVIDKEDVALNVNTTSDLALANKIANKQGKR